MPSSTATKMVGIRIGLFPVLRMGRMVEHRERRNYGKSIPEGAGFLSPNGLRWIYHLIWIGCFIMRVVEAG